MVVQCNPHAADEETPMLNYVGARRVRRHIAGRTKQSSVLQAEEVPSFLLAQITHQIELSYACFVNKRAWYQYLQRRNTVQGKPT